MASHELPDLVPVLVARLGVFEKQRFRVLSHAIASLVPPRDPNNGGERRTSQAPAITRHNAKLPKRPSPASAARSRLRSHAKPDQDLLCDLHTHFGGGV